MNVEDLKSGMAVQTGRVLMKKAARGFCVAPRYLQARQANAEGTALNAAPGHGGDVWFVMHADQSVAAYGVDEFERVVVSG